MLGYYVNYEKFIDSTHNPILKMAVQYLIMEHCEIVVLEEVDY